MLDTRTKIVILVFVPNRSAETLVAKLRENVAAGSIIWSDLWRGYAGLEQAGFTHQTVNHSLNFVNPETGVHTQAIEAAWSRVKKFLRRKDVMTVPEDRKASYLDEYMWRQFYENKKNAGETFYFLLRHLAEWEEYGF
ncbi:unnamed protein product [Allacma fusca]|uniref:ISXO2-like transposase domain-containing protein n=1 Tax=Allacma fusca TaxID=39272 RepID=A0A8J2P5T0_9HEXA|nr:unnamed protein product [Allacma fusca]